MNWRVGIFVAVVCVVGVFLSCRRNPPSLVDANRAPDTELWYAPPESTEYEYKVHMFWRGVDLDGMAVKYIWAITDTLVRGELGWNPAERLRDFRFGKITTLTDSVFSFTAFRNVGGVGLKKNRQAFHVAAIDDNGVIDPTPAAVEFVATVDKLPEIKFALAITKIAGGVKNTIKKAFAPGVLDTVGMYRPFSMSYHGVTTNGLVRAYQFFPLSADVELAGARMWTTDLSDTVRVFPNVGPAALKKGIFALAAQCRDDANAESPVDAGTFRTGVCRVVVNFDPDTEIIKLLNTYFIGNEKFVDSVNFKDSKPDTVPYESWITVFYRGWDSPFDSTRFLNDPKFKCPFDSLELSPVPSQNKCLGYQANFSWVSNRIPTSNYVTNPWMPSNPVDNNLFGLTDSMSINIGSFEYTIYARAVDENLQPDGNPATVPIIGNFDPIMDTYSIQSYTGQVLRDGDTLLWDWWAPADSGETSDGRSQKRFYFVIKATGRDHPKDPRGSGVTTWFYQFTDIQTKEFQKFAISGSWHPGLTMNVLSDTFRYFAQYPKDDPTGNTLFGNGLPTWNNKTFDFVLLGRDLPRGTEFSQKAYYGGKPQLINKTFAETLGRWTNEFRMRFTIKIER